MVIIPQFYGRAGNIMFQYIFARLLAIKNGLYLETQWPEKMEGYFKVTPYISGKKIINDNLIKNIEDITVHSHNRPWFQDDYRNNKLILKGYFQSPVYYDTYEKLIKDFIIIQPIQKRPDNEIVMHLRLGDYFTGTLRSVIDPQWYHQILTITRFNKDKNKLFIVIEDKDNPRHKKYLNFFDKYNPTIISQTPEEDFHFIRNFNTIICSNSSFCWWAAWLSDAKLIFTFSKWIREPNGIRMRMPFARRFKPYNGEWINGEF